MARSLVSLNYELRHLRRFGGLVLVTGSSETRAYVAKVLGKRISKKFRAYESAKDLVQVFSWMLGKRKVVVFEYPISFRWYVYYQFFIKLISICRFKNKVLIVCAKDMFYFDHGLRNLARLMFSTSEEELKVTCRAYRIESSIDGNYLYFHRIRKGKLTRDLSKSAYLKFLNSFYKNVKDYE